MRRHGAAIMPVSGFDEGVALLFFKPAQPYLCSLSHRRHGPLFIILSWQDIFTNGRAIMGGSLHNKIRLKRRIALLNTNKLRTMAIKASTSLGLISLAGKLFK
jgi:hypothetical protein